MTGLQFVRDQLYLAHGWFLGTVKGLTDEQLNYLPPGTGHPIGALIQHLLFVEDDTINRRLRGGDSLWNIEGWSSRTGVPNLVGADEETYRAFRMPADALNEYRKRVWEASDEYLTGLTETELLRDAVYNGGATTVAGMLGILLNHTAIHVGEISATKGFQGLRGSPL